MDPQPQTVADLQRPEHVVLWAMRVWVEECTAHGGFGEMGYRERLQPELTRACGRESGSAAAVAANSLFIMLCAAGRRVRYVHRRDCAAVSADELMVMSIVAALQADDEALALAKLEWMLPRAVARIAARHAKLLADALMTGGQWLPLRLVAAPERVCEDTADVAGDLVSG